ncbi:MAG: AAA family ATPase [Gracilibacteraceae bacterium]|jgi:DNA helicase-2/ATP-dependent DNA helicase PcrA|nr:AAA family ATPase [Gracilibacteraceae bacterium]
MTEAEEREYGEEKSYLRGVITEARRQWAEAGRRRTESGEAVLALKREFREDTAHAVYGLYAAPNFHDLVNLSQAAQPVIEKIDAYEAAERKIFQLEKTLDTPYFARIDFSFADAPARAEKIYIGRTSLRAEDGVDLLVYDWRSPVAGVYYRFGPGPACYEAPAGPVEGTVALKRQYEIKGGELEYFFDADVQVYDEYFRRLLARRASPQMRAIIETIQRDQDVAIRDEQHDLLMVQGAAGSGKTSAALHRVAWLLYRDAAAGLTARHILVLAPSGVFEEYVARVLPELGEVNVFTAVFEELLTEILREVLPQVPVRSRWLSLEEALQADGARAGRIRRSLALKNSSRWVSLLKEFLRRQPEEEEREIYRGAEHDADDSLNDPDRPPAPARQPRQSGGRAEKQGGQRPGRALALYRALARDREIWAKGGGDEETRRLTEGALDGLSARKGLRYEDALTLAFLQVKTAGCAAFYHIRQVVIDEAQDYGPLHFELLRLLFPAARFTVLGDTDQALEQRRDAGFYDLIAAALGRRRSALVRLERSFRSTAEIIAFSERFRETGEPIRHIGRQGDRPDVFAASDWENMAAEVARRVESYREEGCRTIALLCKTGREAARWRRRLAESVPGLRLLTGEESGRAERGLDGTTTMPIYLAKGLEFDAVLVLGVNRSTFSGPDDRRLLYIACTRALHRLSLFCLRGQEAEWL